MREKKKTTNPLLTVGDDEGTTTETKDEDQTTSSMSSLDTHLGSDSETVGTDVIICDDKNRFVTKIAMISYFHDKAVSSRPLTVTRRGLIRVKLLRIGAEKAQNSKRRKEYAKREMNFIKIEHPDAFELLGKTSSKATRTARFTFATRSSQATEEGQSLSMKTLKSALNAILGERKRKSSDQLEDERQRGVVRFYQRRSAVDVRDRKMVAIHRKYRHRFPRLRNLAHPYKAFHWKSKGYLDWRSAI